MPAVKKKEDKETSRVRTFRMKDSVHAFLLEIAEGDHRKPANMLEDLIIRAKKELDAKKTGSK